MLFNSKKILKPVLLSANSDFRLQKGSPCANADADPANIPQPRFMGEAFHFPFLPPTMRQIASYEYDR